MKEKKPKAPRAKVPCSMAARRLKAKLEALVAAPGTPDEGIAAALKLAKLDAKFDWSQNKEDREGIFAGQFQAASDARPVRTCHDWSIASYVKWAIEESTGIRCVFHGSELLAQATPKTAAKLSGIAATIEEGFQTLWGSFRTFPTVTSDDRGLFYRGLYDGMQNQPRLQGEQLPPRVVRHGRGRTKKAAVGHASGLNLHPYTFALDLGKQIRFSVPLPEVTNQIEAARVKLLEAR